MLSQQTAEKNIARAYRRATPKQRQAGFAWYAEANLFCRRLSIATGHSVKQIAGALAALSPQCSWPENLRATIALAKTRSTGASLTLPLNRTKAFSILFEDQDPETVLGGEKVKAFYHNILNPCRSYKVTIDTHAARVAFGTFSLSSRELAWVFRKQGNILIQKAYCKVARRHGILPHKLQAAVWLRMKADLDKQPADVQLSLYIK